MKTQSLIIGTAGWNVAKESAEHFPQKGSHLVRYSQVLNGVEINSSFYKDHRPATYKRWARETPANFAFSVKLSRSFTHDERLETADSRLTEVLEGVKELGEKFRVLLVQLPPSLSYDSVTADRFFRSLRECYPGGVACEPRHITWSGGEARALFRHYGITKVIADPEPCPCEAIDEQRLVYRRLHGSPDIYKSSYESDFLQMTAKECSAEIATKEVWCIFDNTTFGHATRNALELAEYCR